MASFFWPATTGSVRDFLPKDRPVLMLAPMQAVTDLPFMRVMERYGGPDVYVTEYFRVHVDSTLHPWILRSITENPGDKPVFAQMIGQSIPDLVRTAKELMQYPVAGVDLNLGCPAPVVCRKDAGGGLLRNPHKIDQILAALREAIDGRFTVKTRIGFDDQEEFETLLDVFSRHEIDALTIHGRTVKERYSTPVHPDLIHQAVNGMNCPVIANGNIVDVATGRAMHEQSGAAGLMVGRGAIRNPYLFSQLRASYTGQDPKVVTRQDIGDYASLLFEETARLQRDYEPLKHVTRMKKYMTYIAVGFGEECLFRMQRMKTPEEFHQTVKEFILGAEPAPVLPPEGTKLYCGFTELLRQRPNS